MSALCRSRARGAVGVALIAAIVIVEVVIVVSVVAGRLQHDLTPLRLETSSAFYAAEAGMAIALREHWLDADLDGDGGIGTLSDDGDSQNDPTLGGASLHVRVEATDSETVLVASARCGDSRRKVELAIAGD